MSVKINDLILEQGIRIIPPPPNAPPEPAPAPSPSPPPSPSPSPSPVAQGQSLFTSPGTWTAPPTTTSISAVAIGGGGGAFGWASAFPATPWPGFAVVTSDWPSGGWPGGGGGALAYMNNYPVLPGNTYNIVVGTAGTSGRKNWNASGATSQTFPVATYAGGGGHSGIQTPTASYIIYAGGGHKGAGGGPYTTASGNGYEPFSAGFLGSPVGSDPFSSTQTNASKSSGSGRTGGGFGGSGGSGGNPAGGMTNGVQNNLTIGGGGNASKYTGNGPNGSGGNPAPPRRFRGNRGAGSGVFGQGVVSTTFDIYGRGGGGASIAGANSASGGAVRIVWPGVERQFPNVNILDLPDIA